MLPPRMTKPSSALLRSAFALPQQHGVLLTLTSQPQAATSWCLVGRHWKHGLGQLHCPVGAECLGLTTLLRILFVSRFDGFASTFSSTVTERRAGHNEHYPPLMPLRWRRDVQNASQIPHLFKLQPLTTEFSPSPPRNQLPSGSILPGIMGRLWGDGRSYSQWLLMLVVNQARWE